MRWALAAAAAVALAACYAPALPAGSPCDPARDSCPVDQTCVATGGGGVCMAMGRTVDGGIDGAPVGKGPCLGGKLLGSVCLAQAPAGPVSLGGAQPLNTAAVGAGGCTEIHDQTGGPALCIVAGTTIEIAASATLRAIALVPSGSTAASTNPLVLFATQSITVSGTLDVSSHAGETFGGTPGLGAGARTVAGCLAAGVDGPIGMSSIGGGGAAGGSFGGAGAAGGNGNGNAVGHGNPAAPLATNLLVGGCPGGHGGDGEGGGGGGPGGAGGGAVYLLAGDAITIAGKIDASGSGGGGGGRGDNSSGAGGGGGAGGMIGLEATHIAVMTAAALFANGGGGGAGGGNVGDNDAGTPGADPSAAGTPAGGGIGSNGGGAGGAGAFGTTAPTAGARGSGNGSESAGGGGGGGVGAVKVFAAQTPSLDGKISPPQS